MTKQVYLFNIYINFLLSYIYKYVYTQYLIFSKNHNLLQNIHLSSFFILQDFEILNKYLSD